MKLLSNLKLSTKLFLIIIPTLLLAGYFVTVSSLDNFRESSLMADLEVASGIGTEIGALAHEVQKERGLSSGFLSNQGTRFGDELRAQRELTTTQVQKMRSLLENMSSDDPNRELLAPLLQLTERIPVLRGQVDRLELTANQAIDAYTEINTYGLDLITELIPDISNAEVIRQINGYVSFLKSKERSGIERAVGTQAFSLGALNAELYRRFSTLVSEQNTFTASFQQQASATGIAAYEEAKTTPAFDEVETMRLELYQNEELTYNPAYWFSTITEKINKLYEIEGQLNREVVEASQAIAADARNTLLLVSGISLAVVILVIVLVVLVVRDILGSVGKLGVFSKAIAAGKLSFKVDLEAKDEFGELGATMNTMAHSIRVSQHRIKKQQLKAQSLYENVYRTSEVVFENINQGVFLINSNYEISKLYSKSLESIFDESEIAGRTLTDFFSRRLLSRDQEALKLFTKNLFNAKLKDVVLRRLNPVENVQIYNDGTESTDQPNVKHVKVSFSRIWKKDQIADVMVTVEDVTETVLLQKELSEQDEKNRQEYEQLISIMKVDPAALRHFIKRAEIEIRMINDQYETYEGSDYAALAQETFVTVHNLKGNAALIESKLIEERLHEVEDLIVRIKGRNIDGKDFIKVIYELNDIQQLLINMTFMIDKIAKFNDDAANRPDEGSNDRLLEAFKRATQRMALEYEKAVSLDIINQKEILIPEEYKIEVKDMIIQLIRNSFAHGIEDASSRKSGGKDATATIQLSFDQDVDGNLVIGYKDDGRGLQKDKIIEKSKDLGIYDAKVDYEKDEQYLYDLIFTDGFSSSDQASSLSGRGQGMSIIREVIEKMGGRFTVNSIENQFFEMAITVPMSGASMKKSA